MGKKLLADFPNTFCLIFGGCGIRDTRFVGPRSDDWICRTRLWPDDDLFDRSTSFVRFNPGGFIGITGADGPVYHHGP